MRNYYLFLLTLLIYGIGFGQALLPGPVATPASPSNLNERVRVLEESVRFADQGLTKTMDDLPWHQKPDDVTIVDQVRYTSKSPHVTTSSAGQGANNPVVIPVHGKKVEYKICQDAPGGHRFNRLDMKPVRESRQETYRFLARYLTPPGVVK